MLLLPVQPRQCAAQRRQQQLQLQLQQELREAQQQLLGSLICGDGPSSLAAGQALLLPRLVRLLVLLLRWW
jgi:hypothetical protein